jgi:hypothetical protein
VVRIAPRLSARLVAEIGRLDDERVPIAETWRRTRAAARRMALPEPSYERVRTIVHMHRRWRRRPSTASIVADVALYTRPPIDLLERAAGVR